MSYVELEEAKAYMGIASTSTGDDALLRDLVEEATALIELETGRVFEAASSTKYYESDALEGNVLWLDDDLVSITTLTHGDDDATTIASTEYWLIPRNDGPPYWGIRLKSESDYNWEWDVDGWVSVLGTWGYSAAPPSDIVLACKRLVAYLYQQKDSAVYEVTVYPEQGVQVTPQGIPVDVERILRKYRRLAG